MRRGHVRERRFDGKQKLSARFDESSLLRESLQRFRRDGALDAKLARARAPERREMRARAQSRADGLGQSAHVSPRGADYARARVARRVAVRLQVTSVFVSLDFKLAHAHAHGLSLYLLAAPREFIELLSADLLRRVHRRNLLDIPAQECERRLQLFALDGRAVLRLFARLLTLAARARQVARLRRVAEPYRRLILLLRAREKLREPRRAPQEQHEHARREGVER